MEGTTIIFIDKPIRKLKNNTYENMNVNGCVIKHMTCKLSNIYYKVIKETPTSYYVERIIELYYQKIKCFKCTGEINKFNDLINTINP